MFIYISLYITPLLALTLPSKLSRKLALYIIVLLSFLIAGLRGTVGIDTFAYKEIFNSLSLSTYNPYLSMEPFLLIVFEFVSKFTNESQVALASIAAIQALLLFKIVNSIKYPFLFLFVYFISFYLEFHTNTLRAGLAVLFFLNAINANSSRKSVAFVIMSLLSHVSILFLIPIWFVKKFDFKFRFYFLLFGLLIIFFVIAEPFLDKKISNYNVADNGISIHSFFLFIAPAVSFFLASALKGRFDKVLSIVFGLLIVCSVLMLYFEIFYRVRIMIMLTIIYLYCSGYYEISLSSARNMIPMIVSILISVMLGIISTHFSQERYANTVYSDYHVVPYTFFFNDL